MSSYQFVNSLASCYQQGQARPGASPEGHPHPQANSPGSDYYNPNAVPTYTAGGCYSPQQYPGQYMHQGPGDMIDYTQLHTASQHQRLGGVGHLQPLHHHSVTSPGAVSPILNNNTTVTNLSNANSCKYADSTTASTTNGISSPQDLSTSGQPTRSSPPLKSSPATTSARTSAASATSPSASGTQNSTSGPASQSSSSPASSTSSSSSNTGNNNSTGKSGSTGNPPQIYPWMKRVHLGQSK